MLNMLLIYLHFYFTGDIDSPHLPHLNFLQLGSTGCVGAGPRVFERKILRISVFFYQCEKSFKFFGPPWEVRETLHAYISCI